MSGGRSPPFDEVVYELVKSSLIPYLDRSMRYIGYIRVSTDLQDVGIEVQKEAILNYAKYKEIIIDSFHIDENISGAVSFEKRPALRSILENLNKDDVIIVQKRDRLGRDVFLNNKIENEITDKGGRVLSTLGEGMDSDTAESKLMRIIFDAFSGYERMITVERIKKGMKVKKDRGEVVGSIPYGYLVGPDGKKLIKHPDEQAIMEEVKELRNNKIKQYVIADHLNNKGLTLRGIPWRRDSVSYICRIINGTYK